MPELARFRAKHGCRRGRSLPATSRFCMWTWTRFLFRWSCWSGRSCAANRWWSADGRTSAAWFPRPVTKRANLEFTRRCRCERRQNSVRTRFFWTGITQKYGEWSDRVATILAKFSPIVEMVSIDEAYLDLAGTERLHGPPLAAADKLLRTITKIDGTSLLCRTGFHAFGGQSCQRSGQAARSAVGCRRARKRDFLRRCRCERFPASAK